MEDVEMCGNPAVAKCHVKILFKTEGCNKLICEEHRGKDKMCMCIDQKQMESCEGCQPAIKELAGKWNFFLPMAIFVILTALIFLPWISVRLTELHDI